MFVMKKATTTWWPVNVKVPHEKIVGRFETHTFEAEFKIIDADEGQARQDARATLLQSDDAPEVVLKALNEFDFETWSNMVINWRGVFDENKNEIEFSHEMLIQAVKQPLTRAAFERAYHEIVSGEARRKNS